MEKNNGFLKAALFSTLPDYSFKKKDRLLKREEFTRSTPSEKKIHTTYFIAVFRENDLTNHRLGVTVSKKVGCAVTRNRIKRLTREYFRQNRQQITVFLDLNIIAKKKAANASSSEIFLSLEKIFNKANRLFY